MQHPKEYYPKISLYWLCQCLGWGSLSAYWAFRIIRTGSYGWHFDLLNYFLDIAIGVGLTHGYRLVARKLNWKRLQLPQLFKTIIPSIIVLSIFFTLVNNLKWYCFQLYIFNNDMGMMKTVFSWEPLLITGVRTMLIWVLVYHLYHYYQREISTVKQNAELLVIAKQAQLDNLAAQLNPHFLFNSLNSVKSLIIENPEQARRAVDLLSDLLRSSLYKREHTSITIAQELALVKDYIELEQLRFEERLSVTWSVDEKLRACKIPILSLQLLVENAIKHGIDRQIEGGNIRINIQQKGEAVEVVVENPGILSTAPGKGLGLKNLKKRLSLNYEEAASFELVALPHKVVKAVLTIPMYSNE